MHNSSVHILNKYEMSTVVVHHTPAHCIKDEGGKCSQVQAVSILLNKTSV